MRGLLVIEPLYHQIIAGNKTQTRRSGGLDKVNGSEYLWEITGSEAITQAYPIPYKGIIELTFTTIEHIPHGDMAGNHTEICKPRYKPGEVLYLKEPIILMGGEPVYKFDLHQGDEKRTVIKWSNKLFMATKDARAFIRITNIKCERLLDISDEDCIAEGIERADSFYESFGCKFKNYISEPDFVTPKGSFISLFKFANKMKSNAYTGNPWVWVYDFEYLPDYKF